MMSTDTAAAPDCGEFDRLGPVLLTPSGLGRPGHAVTTTIDVRRRAEAMATWSANAEKIGR